MPRTFLVERIVDLQSSAVKDSHTEFKVTGDDVTPDDVTTCELMKDQDHQRYTGETEEQMNETMMTSERAVAMATNASDCSRQAHSAAAAPPR